MNKLITLTTDFGLLDPYVAEIKAVILGINPEAKIVDISHQIEKFNIKMGAYILASAASYFPKGTIHVAIIDPGVGTKRKPILIETKDSFLMGPDNGILALAADKQGIKNVYEKQIPSICCEKFQQPSMGETFSPQRPHIYQKVFRRQSLDLKSVGLRSHNLQKLLGKAQRWLAKSSMWMVSVTSLQTLR